MVIIPALNEGRKIGEVVREVAALGYDAAVIDDGSKDDTAAVAKEAGALVLSHVINRGQGAALRTGIGYARRHNYEFAVFFDADGQMSAAEIEKLIDVLKSGAQVALGSRFLGTTEGMPRIKWLTLKLGLIFTRLTTGLKLTDVHNGFQAWRLSALKATNLVQDRQAYASELLQEISRCRLVFQEVPVTIKYTRYSKSKGQSVFNAFNILWDLIIKR